MTDCIFCKIAKKEIPANILYEDENFLAFLDIHPLSAGHALVVPKEHSRWVWDITSDLSKSPNIGEYFSIVAKIAQAQQKAFGTEAILSKIVGEEVHHAHIWVYPNPKEVKGDKSDFVGNAKKIVENI